VLDYRLHVFFDIAFVKSAFVGLFAHGAGDGQHGAFFGLHHRFVGGFRA
jgi:hypothetical protein